MAGPCALCAQPGKLCSGCKDIRYCSRAHQKNDWPTHKVVCKKLAERDDSPHPGFTWALYFPENDSELEFRLFPVTPGQQGCTTGCACGPGCNYICSSYSHHTRKCQHVYLSIPGVVFNDPVVNKTIEKLTNGAVTSFKGPATAWSRSARGGHKQQGSSRVFRTTDMTTMSFRAILNEIHDIQAVCINCDGLVNERIAPRFEVTTVSSFSFFRFHGNEAASSLTKHTGVRLEAQRTYIPKDVLRKRISRDQLNRRNSISRMLSIPCDTEEHRFGLYRRAKDTGNVVVLRKDRQPLTINYVRTLCDWVEAKLRPMFMKARADCLKLDRHYLNNLRTGTNPQPGMEVIRTRVLNQVSRQNLLVWSRSRLSNEMTTNDNVVKIPENHDVTDDEMPYDYED
ncbi:hypothetical protein E4T43_06544 [Aureobasidium subglaciale]|nr:hypothetical protein E4T43_06544 [Aureobasidium subglaciale]